MVRLNAHPEKYHGIRVENCGLLFLGTPHSGTVQADWNDFVTGIAVLLGVRFDVVDSLRSFNGFSVESKEAFGSLPKQPPYFCLCETKLVTIAPGISRLVSFESSYSITISKVNSLLFRLSRRIPRGSMEWWHFQCLTWTTKKCVDLIISFTTAISW
jgi:hypothetical protein